MRSTTDKINTQIHFVMTDSETLAFAHCKHLLVDTFIGLLAMVDSDETQSCICRKCIIGVHCAIMQFLMSQQTRDQLKKPDKQAELLKTG